MCSCSNAFRNLFLPATVPCLQAVKRWRLPPHQKRRKLYNLARLRATTKVRRVLIREMLFADDDALTSHTEDAQQRLIRSFTSACREFGLTISLMFLSLDTELNTRIGKASTAMARLATRVWDNSMLTTNTKMKVHQACVLITLLYSSETWTLYSRQERKLNTFHLRCLRQILGISWQDHVSNKQVLEQAGIQSVFVILSQNRLRWLGHGRHMLDGRIPKDILYGELATGSRPAGRPVLWYKDVCKRDMKTGNINSADWEATAADRRSWRLAVKAGIQTSELKREEQREEKRQRRRQRAASASTEPGASTPAATATRPAAPELDCTSQQTQQLNHGLIHGAYSIVSRDRRMRIIYKQKKINNVKL